MLYTVEASDMAGWHIIAHMYRVNCNIIRDFGPYHQIHHAVSRLCASAEPRCSGDIVYRIIFYNREQGRQLELAPSVYQQYFGFTVKQLNIY